VLNFASEVVQAPGMNQTSGTAPGPDPIPVAEVQFHLLSTPQARARARRCLATDRLKPALAALKAKTRPRGPQPPAPRKSVFRASNRSPSCTGACASTARRPWPW
jgi:hypothetical protein